MNLLELRNRIRDKAIDNGLTYTEIETLFDVNLLLEQTMPCLMWRYSGETNNFDEVGTEMSLNVYLITTFPDSVRVETDTYQRDYIVTQQNALRTYFYNWLQAMPFESGDDYLEIISTEEIPIAERLGINEFLTVDFRVNISIKRDFCVDPEQVTPSPSQVQVYFNDVLRYTQACNVDLELILKNQDGDLINDATFTGYEIVVTQGGGQVTININGVLWDVIDAGETENIIVRQQNTSTQVGSKQGQYYRIADSVVTLEDALGVTLSTTNVPAEDSVTIVAPSARVSNSDDSYDTNVVSGGDLELPDITVSNSDDSYSVTYPSVQDVELPDVTISNSDASYSVTSPSVQNVSIPDEDITLNGGAFLTKPSVKDQDILLVDQDNNPITPTLSGNTIQVATGWQRPSEWLDMPSISATDTVLYALVFVYENGENLITFGAGLNTVTIDWGDGSATENTQGYGASTNTHNYDYASIVQTPITYNGKNVKQCILTLTVNTSADMRFTESAGINAIGNNAIVDILCCFYNTGVRLAISNQLQSKRRMDDLRIFKCLDLGTDTNFFWANYSWQNLKLEIFDIPTNGLQTHRANARSFENTIINQSIGNIRGFGYSFLRAVLNGGVGNITDARSSDFENATLVSCNDVTVNGVDAFWYCKVNILGSITATTTSFRRLFQGCTTKRLVFASLPPQPTDMGSNGGCFSYMGYLEEMIVPGLQNGFTIEGSNMGADALNAMFTSLGTANGAQTITITGNPGTATCDTTIATGKGFTIVV